MKEKDYWVALEFRVCAEMDGIEECQEKGLWCDGFLPCDYQLDSLEPSVRGRAWICLGEQQQSWEFKLELPPGTRDQNSIDWEYLIPPPSVTQWMSLDFEARRIDLNPMAAVPNAT